MYTFIVGPWLPTSSAISVGLIHKPVRERKTRIWKLHVAQHDTFIQFCVKYLSKTHETDCASLILSLLATSGAKKSPGEHFYEHAARPAA